MLRRAIRSPLQRQPERKGGRFASHLSLSCVVVCSSPAAAAASHLLSSFRAASSIASATDLAAYKKRAHALYLLKKTPHIALSCEAALRLLTDESGLSYIPPAEQMTREEAADFLRACHDAGLVIISPAPGSASTKQQMVYPDPIAVFGAKVTQVAVAKSGGSNTSSSTSSGSDDTTAAEGGAAFLIRARENHSNHIKRMLTHRAHHEITEDEEAKRSKHTQELLEDPDVVAVRAIRAHRRFWALFAFFMSSQMLLFAYWTFIEYSWDVMEPFTYFVGCVYMIGFFSYFVMTKRSVTFGELDTRIIRRTVAKSSSLAKKAK